MIDFSCSCTSRAMCARPASEYGSENCASTIDALRDIGGIIADPLHVAGDLQRRDDLAQVAGDRLAQCQQADDEALDLALQRIDLRVLLHRAGRRMRRRAA